MKGYLVSVLLISAAASLSSHFFGDAGGSRLGKTALATVLLWAVLSPLSSLLSALPSLPSLELPPISEEEKPLYEARAEAAFCEGIAAAVSEKFSIKKEQITVRTEGFSVEKMHAERIRILLHGKSVMADSYAIADYVTGVGLGECEVEIEFGGT